MVMVCKEHCPLHVFFDKKAGFDSGSRFSHYLFHLRKGAKSQNPPEEHLFIH